MCQAPRSATFTMQRQQELQSSGHFAIYEMSLAYEMETLFLHTDFFNECHNTAVARPVQNLLYPPSNRTRDESKFVFIYSA
jgi:hypothetical protein